MVELALLLASVAGVGLLWFIAKKLDQGKSTVRNGDIHEIDEED